MLQKTNPTETKSWKKLEDHFKEMNSNSLVSLFAEDQERFANFSILQEAFLFDFSKNFLTQKTLLLLEELFEEVGVSAAINQLFCGEKINETENRAVLHSALRNRSGKPVFVDGVDAMPQIESTLNRLKMFSEQVRSGEWTGFTGKRIKHVVNIGIGGSDLGPKMVTQALKPYQSKNIEFHFVSNVDGSEIEGILESISPEETLFIIASKTFTTQETMANAQACRNWFLESATEKDIAKHFVAVSSNLAEVVKFGINPEETFEMWDWVGGRYSVWGAIGLPVMISIGFDSFISFLEGAHEADEHFINAPFSQNIPKIMAAIGIWYVNFLGANNSAVIPYTENLKYFPAFLQQLDMESNGKHINRKGEKISWKTGPIIWGEPGTNGQHAFFQHIHQGTEFIPCDFIAAANAHHNLTDNNKKLLANFFAQTEALMIGKSESTVRAELAAQGLSAEEIEKLLPFKVFEGNKPTNTFLVDELSPYNLGKLIAFYEHKVFVQGVVWNIFSFDQWGVELGKELAKTILSEMEEENIAPHHLSSTRGLLETYFSWKK